MSNSAPSFKTIIVTRLDNPAGLKVGRIQFNRPDVLNALNIELMGELLSALKSFDQDNEVGC
jgi:enoyl-CoA hydratase/carnithine racemase